MPEELTATACYGEYLGALRENQPEPDVRLGLLHLILGNGPLREKLLEEASHVFDKYTENINDEASDGVKIALLECSPVAFRETLALMSAEERFGADTIIKEGKRRLVDGARRAQKHAELNAAAMNGRLQSTLVGFNDNAKTLVKSSFGERTDFFIAEIGADYGETSFTQQEMLYLGTEERPGLGRMINLAGNGLEEEVSHYIRLAQRGALPAAEEAGDLNRESLWRQILLRYESMRNAHGRRHADDWLERVANGSARVMDGAQRAVFLDSRVWADPDGTSWRIPENDPAAGDFASRCRYPYNRPVHQAFGYLAWNESYPGAVQLSEGNCGDISLSDGLLERVFNTTLDRGWRHLESTLVLGENYRALYESTSQTRRRFLEAEGLVGEIDRTYLNDSFIEATKIGKAAERIHTQAGNLVQQYASVL